ncbi:gamma-glutamyl-gamma-aminobutyrate hydrolase family protein [Streptomyces sp. NPDC020965]|uniref:gamma-glutamyl-gamma-aminobutyrate hydrolase family protein n=1 Tax=Streptomyces sp. NPDC020965 TaxID=3365105 RepID=UPI003794331D
MPRPLIAIPARFSASASAVRYAAEASAHALVEAVWRGGGEPVTIHPYAPGGFAYAVDVAARLARFDGVLLPGGDDVAPHRYGAPQEQAEEQAEDAGRIGHAAPARHDGRPRTTEDLSAAATADEQDGFDLEVARQALRAGRPLLAVCRGLQIVNTVLGGTLRQDGRDGVDREHLSRTHPVTLRAGSRIARIIGGEKAEVSGHHRRLVERLGAGLRITATAADGSPEALELVGEKGWLTAVRWHPEDTAHEDPAQQRVFDTLVRVATR